MADGDKDHAPSDIDTSRPNVARVYDYMLGGKDNFAADRQVAEMTLRIASDARQLARFNREFIRRVVHYLAGEAGIRQFLDIGSGLPARENVHQIAQSIAPKARVVYVDNDPMVLAHSRAVLATTRTTSVVAADLRRPSEIIEHPDVRRLIDFSEPVGLLLFAVLHHLGDRDDPAGVTARLRTALPPGSHLAISHLHNPGPARPGTARRAAMVQKLFNEKLGSGRWRTRQEILTYFGDLELVEPGLVPLTEWRPSPMDRAEQSVMHHGALGGLARKP
ncbi:SAM-dependent methyltransferase [Microtetraspora sp. AC03309]|uniref:SAM-dependent methyltransferase n=1 Tax=Microtetraspora sp. AC03309 TaxID=2779376 RepID=UPI001E4A7D43|nr:SAM-dependent methyltransferase [Microtetraspora sp. AC03309]